MNFEDTVKKARNTIKSNAQKQLPKGQSTEAASSQLTTIATGKAAPSGPSGQSNIAEQAVQSAAIGQLDSIDQQSQQQLDQLQVQAQSADTQQKAVESQRRSQELKLDTQRSNQTDEILASFRNNTLDIESEEGQLQLQIMGNNLARNNKRYMQKIRDVAAKRNINDKVSHRREGVRLQIGNATTELYKQLGFLTSEGDLNRNFKERMARMGEDDLFKISNAKIADEREAAKIGVITTLANSGVDAAVKSRKDK